MTLLERLQERARARPVRVVLPEMEEARVARAVARLKSEGLAEPVALAEPDAAQLAALLACRPMKEALAWRMLQKPMIRAAAMVAAGQAEALVAGAATPTRRVIEAAALAIGPAPGIATPSSFFLMLWPDGRQMLFADCALNVAPDGAMLADIAQASAASAQALLGRAEVAMLSYSTGSSGSGESVVRVRKASALLAERGVAALGPVQADAVLNRAIAEKKGVAGGSANVLIFPSLDAGNIAYKLVQELAGAQAVGPFLQGFRRPVCDLSRGATVEDIVAAVVVAGAL